MGLQVFRSLWGCESHVPYSSLATIGERLALLKTTGYDGVEASLADLGSSTAERRGVVQALRDTGLQLIVGAYSSWVDYDATDWRDLHTGVDGQLHTLEAQLQQIESLGAEGVLQKINVHSGSDAWTEEQARQYFARALPLGAGLGVPVSHETHRGRPLANLFVCHRLCEEHPELRLTLDASHWFLVCERLVGSMYSDSLLGKSDVPGLAGGSYEEAVLELLCARVDHIHARIGTPESPQVVAMPKHASVENNWACRPSLDGAGADTDTDTEWEADAAAAHEQLWQAVWRIQAGAGACSTATPEYGPLPYTPMEAGTGAPLSDVWGVTNDAAHRLRALYNATR